MISGPDPSSAGAKVMTFSGTPSVRKAGTRTAGAVGVFWLTICLLAAGLPAQDEAGLVSKLKSASVPAKGAALKSGALVVSLEYATPAAMDPEKIRGHALTVFRTAGGSLPAGASKVSVEFGGPGVIYASWAATAQDAADYAGGRLGEEQFVAGLEKASPRSLKDIMASAVPDEAAIRAEIKRIEAQGRSAAAKPAAAAVARPSPSGSAPPAKDAGSGQTAQPSGQKSAAAGKSAPVQDGQGGTAGARGTADDSPAALFKKGEELLKSRDYWGATEYFRKTLDAYPMESNQALGICYYFGGLLEAALKHFAEAYRRDTKSPTTVLYLATCNDKLGRRDEALRRYEEYLSLDSGAADVIEFVRQRILSLRDRSDGESETG